MLTNHGPSDSLFITKILQADQENPEMFLNYITFYKFGNLKMKDFLNACISMFEILEFGIVKL